MKMNNVFLVIALVVSFNVFSQQRIVVTETTLSLGFDQVAEVFYSFAKGDEIVFNMNMIQGKHIKAVEIVELPNNVVFSAFKAMVLRDKRIKVRNKGLYAFRFYSSSLTNRVCRYRIDRVPVSPATKNFNTNWKWHIVRDTVYTPYQQDSLMGYRTVKYQETVRELKSTKLEEIMLFEKTQTVHSFYNENISRAVLKVDLPAVYNTAMKEEQILAWAYWIGVGQESREAYKKNLSSITKSLGKVADLYYQTPLAGIAVGEISSLITPQTGEDVNYYFISDYQNAQLFYNKQQFLQFDNGKGRAAYGRNDRLIKGTFYIGLLNDNEWRGIEVDIKVMAVKQAKIYENVIYKRERQEPEYLTLNKTRMNINETKIRVPVE
ncbi:hypothetical protein ACFSQJ_04300 [Croceitalea marina]|uniref:Uncharacterized protein n=1 Tax=Croceitalea marina TaxID=1775166 RepID=A0ABW5MT04_9FLAO